MNHSIDKQARIHAHWSFWLICAVALLWNIGGCINYLMQTNLEFVATLPDTHRAIIEGRPAWATAGFAVGVFGGALGCLLLLLKIRYAYPVFIASLVGILVTVLHTIQVASSKIDFSAGEIFIMILSPIIVAVLLIGYAKMAINKHWISR